jgi:transcriptional regulator with XRE-family HTH domain
MVSITAFAAWCVPSAEHVHVGGLVVASSAAREVGGGAADSASGRRAVVTHSSRWTASPEQGHTPTIGQMCPFARTNDACFDSGRDARGEGWQSRCVEMSDVMRARRSSLGLSQADLAAAVGIDVRQIRRYEAGETSPSLPVAKSIAAALQISLDELAGAEHEGIDLTGDWWCAWQTWNQGEQIVNVHQARMRQRGDVLDIRATTRGNHEPERGGYTWRGEFRLWDKEILMGWYVATEGAVRSKGTIYFALHQHGRHMEGRWVGLSHDGPIVTGWGAIARTEDECRSTMNRLLELESR